MIARILKGTSAAGVFLLALAAPAYAGKAIVVDYQAGLVYPVENGKLAREPLITINGRHFKKKYLGTFHITEKVVNKRSNMYNSHGRPISPGEAGARMPYWMRLGRTAQGFHYSSLFSADGPRHASNGCYRLSKQSAVWLFNWTPKGTPVHVVYRLGQSRFAYLAKQRRQSASRVAPGRPTADAPGAARRVASVPLPGVSGAGEAVGDRPKRRVALA